VIVGDDVQTNTRLTRHMNEPVNYILLTTVTATWWSTRAVPQTGFLVRLFNAQIRNHIGSKDNTVGLIW